MSTPLSRNTPSPWQGEGRVRVEACGSQKRTRHRCRTPLPSPPAPLPERERGEEAGDGRRTAAALVLFVGVSACGCSTKVDAQFRLTQGPVMVFVDDVHERIDWPAARRYLWDDVTQELLRTGSATRIVPLATEDSLRQTLPDFSKKSCREIGELAGAQQVLWIEVRSFLADEMIVDASNAAHFAVTVKVVDAGQKQDRRRVRVWPETPEGRHVSASMTGAAVASAKNKDAIARELTAKLAVQIARLFHDHTLEDFEKPPESTP